MNHHALKLVAKFYLVLQFVDVLLWLHEQRLTPLVHVAQKIRLMPAILLSHGNSMLLSHLDLWKLSGMSRQ